MRSSQAISGSKHTGPALKNLARAIIARAARSPACLRSQGTAPLFASYMADFPVPVHPLLLAVEPQGRPLHVLINERRGHLLGLRFDEWTGKTSRPGHSELDHRRSQLTHLIKPNQLLQQRREPFPICTQLYLRSSSDPPLCLFLCLSLSLAFRVTKRDGDIEEAFFFI